MDCDGAVRNIEKEILRECSSNSIQINRNFLNYYIKLLALNPAWGISKSFMTNREDVQNFIKYVVNIIQDQATPHIITLKIQFYFRCNYGHRYKMVKANRKELLNKLKPLESEIIDIRFISTPDEIELMYKRVVFYLTLASGLGNPLCEPVYKEARTAFGSIVVDEHELRQFTELPRFHKEYQLTEYVKLVTGVRIFNRDCAKGGEGIDDLPLLIKEAMAIFVEKLQANLTKIMDHVNLYTTALDCAMEVQINERGKHCIKFNTPPDFNMSDLQTIKDLLIVYRQTEIYLRKLLDEVAQQETVTDSTFQKMQIVLIELHQVVKHRIAIPVEEVFPHFIKLHNIWSALQDQAILLAKLTQIMNNLMQYSNCLRTFDENIPQSLIPVEVQSMTDAERLSQSHRSSEQSGSLLTAPPQDFEIAAVNSSDELVQLECLGFCPWTLVESNGALMPGNPRLGVMRTLNMNFVVASCDAGDAFRVNPPKCVMNLLTYVRQRPDLVNLLSLRGALQAVQEVVELVREPPLKPLTAEAELQTDMHLETNGIDRNYFWNIWDLKRQAIKLANLTHCMTTSSQTKRSFHRLAISTQTYYKKETGMQTKKDNYSNVPTLSNYFYGLRGRKDDKQFLIELTRPVVEQTTYKIDEE